MSANSDALVASVQGAVLFPSDEGYGDARTGWNRTVDHRPAVIVEADSQQDVSTAVRYAAEAGLAVTVQATGHGGTAAADAATLLLKTGALSAVTVDAASRTARVGAGANWADVIAATHKHGLAPLCGSAPDVAVGGYLTGGGLPVLGRAFGYAADHVREVEVVMADGVARTAGPGTDLFWAVRGGKSNFGILTSAVIDLLPLPIIYGGGLFFDAARAAEVLPAWLSWLADQPDEMCSSVIFLRFPDLPAMPDEVRGRKLVHVRIAYPGPEAEGQRLVRPLRELGPETDAVRELPYTEIGDIYRDPPRPTFARISTALLNKLSRDTVDTLLAVVGPEADLPPGGVELRHLRGALGRQPAVPNAINQRDGEFLLFMSMPAPGEQALVARAAQQKVLDAVAPSDTGRLFPGFTIGADVTAEDIRRGYTRADFDRLGKLKAAYDPDFLFRVNHPIPPAA